MTTCRRCGQTWELDPALLVACPTCRAGVGVACKRPSGHACEVHAARDLLALRCIDGYNPCPGAPVAPPLDQLPMEL